MSKAGDQILAALKQPRMRCSGRVGVLLFGGLFAYNVCTIYIRPYERGVKQVILGGGKGIRDTVYGPGLHWVTPGAERMHRFPTDCRCWRWRTTPPRWARARITAWCGPSGSRRPRATRCPRMSRCSTASRIRTR